MRRRTAPALVSVGLVAALLSAGLAGQATAAPAPQQLVLSVVGDGATTLAVGPTAVSLVTVNADGSATTTPTVQLPVAAADGNRPFTLSGTSSAIGQLALSGDSESLAIAGYSATPGQPIGDPKDSSATVAPRIIASIDADGSVDTSTVLTGAFSADHPRSVVTQDGSSFYVSGNGTDKTPAAGIVLAQRGSTATPTAIAAAPVLNTRNLAIADGRLFGSTGTAARGVYSVGTSPLPTASVTATKIITAPSGTAASFLMLDRDFAVPGVDTAYVIIEGVGIHKFSLTGSTWTARGVIAGDFQAITGQAGGTLADLYAVSLTSAGNSLVYLTDTAASAAPVAAATATTIATAAPNTAFRGVALAPAGWAPSAGTPTVPAPTGVVTPSAASTVLGSGAVSGSLQLASADDSDPATFTVTSDSAQAVITGSGATRTVSVTPTSVGITTVTLTITNPAGTTTGTATFTVGASATTPGMAGVLYHGGSADASTAIALDDEYMLVADDETNVIRLYSRTTSGPALKEFDLSSSIGTKEVDLEASVRVGNTIYWFASHGNNKDSEYKAARSVFFATTIAGTGLGTTLTFTGQYNGLRSDLIAWDAANGNSLGLAAACTLAGGTHPDQTTGCNIEGVDVAADGTTALVAFRSPRVGGKGLVVPVTNVAALIGAEVGAAQFGAPMLLDLGGRTLRELRGNGSGEYLITAGAPDDDAALGWALYRWNGVATSDPILVANLPGTGDAGQSSGSYESIVSVPAQITSGSSIQLLTDNGTTVFYADGVEGKDVAPGLLKFRSNVVTLGDVAAPAATLSASTVAVGGSIDVTAAGFTPGETAEIWVHSDPVRVASVVVPASGIVSARITIPASVDAGTHQVRVIGLGSGLLRVAPLAVTAAAVPGAANAAALAQTGMSTGGVAPAAALLLLLGAAGLLASRRRAA